MAGDTLTLTKIPDVRTAMLIRRPPAEVFRAFADPEVTTRFWFTRSTGRMTPGARLRWTWEMYGVSTEVLVMEVEEGRRLLFQWNDDHPLTVEFRFTPYGQDATFVEVTESGLAGSGDEVVAHVGGSTGGFTIVLCAAKALLEQNVDLNAVRDRHPTGL
ncbi:SRPBCC family protein [Nonomuraea angiospora]|uniref:SRPBCC family protein n=1 Tax=Nonomuraea angiospora TaxID=46172 RepID=UPI0029A40CE1|nr:SRPBCC family protein [Nonomuraea angiospora]MDX3101382.1 SRPBCC family protein [Nonomuraea angiospora]